VNSGRISRILANVARAGRLCPLVHQSHRSVYTANQNKHPVQSKSPLAPVGVDAALAAVSDTSITPRPKIFDEFSLKGRVGIVSGGNRGLGLEMALTLCEAGTKAVYCIDLPLAPSSEWEATRDYVKRMGNGSRLEYVSADVRDQAGIWETVAGVGDKEGRVDVCVAAAGILKAHTDCLTYPAAQFKEVCHVTGSVKDN
jgi:hypothetical protein